MVRYSGVALAVAVTAALAAASDPSPLKGTFVREMIVGGQMGNQIVLTFDRGQLTAKFTSGGRADDGHEGWVTLTFDGEYAVTPGGLVCGVVTGINADLSKIPVADLAEAPIGDHAHKLLGEPFSFRARMTDKGLVVTDVRAPHFDAGPATPKAATGREMVSALASGTYAKSETDKVPVPKLAKSKGGEAAVADVLDRLFGPALPSQARGMNPPAPPIANTGPAGMPPPLSPLPVPNQVIYAQPVPTAPPELPPPVRPVTQIGVPDPRKLRAEQLFHSDFISGPPGALSLSPIPSTAVRIEGGILDDNTPQGTYVRDVVVAEAGGGMRAMLTFKGDRLSAKFVEFVMGDDGKMKSGGYEFECTAHRSADGYVLGRVVGVEVDFKDAPLENGITAETCRGLSKAYGEPFCFRCDVRDGTLTVADLRMPMPEGMATDAKAVRDTAVAFVGGKYKKVESANVPLPKVEKKKPDPPRMELVPNGIRVTTPFTPHPGLPLTVRAEPGPVPPTPSLTVPPMPAPPTLIPTAGQLPPPGSMRAAPVPPMIREAWEQSTLPPLPNPPPIPPTK